MSRSAALVESGESKSATLPRTGAGSKVKRASMSVCLWSSSTARRFQSTSPVNPLRPGFRIFTLPSPRWMKTC